MRRWWLGVGIGLVPGIALAVAPVEGVHQGAEPTRTHQFDRATQRYWSAQAGWTDFVASEGARWEARFDQVTGTPQRAWGPGIPLGTVGSRAQVERAVLDFVHAHPELVGLGEATPKVRSAVFVASTNAWYVDVDTLFEGLPVWRGGLTFRVREGRLVMFGAETYPEAEREGVVSVRPQEALTAFTSAGPAPWADHQPVDARVVWLPEVRSGRAVLRRVWEVRTRTLQPVGQWVAFVDAGSGDLIGWYNEVRFVEGRLEVEHDVRLGDGSLATSPLRNATVVVDGQEVVTDADGAFVVAPLSESSVPLVELRGPRARMRDREGVVNPAVVGGDQLLRAVDFGDRLAAPTAFVWVQAIQDFARSFAPEVGWVDTDVRVNVNNEGSCNAWYDGSINFLLAGDGCRNTGRLADVVFHEWGHGFHASSIVSGNLDGSLGEGAADLLSAFYNDDPRIAPFFFERGSRPLRTADNNTNYDRTYSEDATMVHSNGTIYSGAMWDTREALRVSIGEPAATEVALAIFAGTLKGGPTVLTSFDEAMFADDDDADLANGTPHLCELVEGFGLHGLGPAAGYGTEPQIPNPEFTSQGEDVVLSGVVPNPAPSCIDVRPTAGTLHWRRSGEAWFEEAIEVDAIDVRATISKADLSWGDVVEYYLEIETSTGGVVQDPPGGAIRPHTFFVGDVIEVSCQRFENGDGGFRHSLIAGTEQEGADDWQWGEPRGVEGDPPTAFSGTNVWGNDLGEEGWDGAYQPQKENELRSPVYDTAHYEGVVLRYMRWLNVEDGVFDQARILADDEEVWRNHASDNVEGGEHHVDDGWAPHVVDLQGLGDDGEVRIAWRLNTDGGFEAGGWTIDDVCVYAPATANNRLGISDFVAKKSRKGVTLSWSHPRHAPVRTVRVVRKQGDWPADANDGEVVWTADDVVLEEAVSFLDAGAEGPDLYYAVYASDGTEWLSWTREGLNAAAIDPIPASEKTGCTCSTSHSAPSAVWGVLGALLWRRRRQQRDRL